VNNGKYDPFTVGSFIQVRGRYNLNSDPEEMNDLATVKPETTTELLHELKTKLKQVDEPYL
jgi:hypothetical protein